MALKPLSNIDATPEFMHIDEDGEPDNYQDAVTTLPATQTNTKTEVAEVVQKPRFKSGNVLQDLERAAVFGYKDGVGLKVDKSGFQLASNAKVTIGNKLVVQVLSWKTVYVCSTGTSSAPKDLVAYSDDGVNCNNPAQGLLGDHFKMLKESGYPRAKIEERVVVFGFYAGSERAFPSDVGVPEYVQVSLPPTSAKAWYSYINLLVPSIRRGTVPEDKADIVRLSITIEETKVNGNPATYPLATPSCPFKREAADVPMLMG